MTGNNPKKLIITNFDFSSCFKIFISAISVDELFKFQISYGIWPQIPDPQKIVACTGTGGLDTTASPPVAAYELIKTKGGVWVPERCRYNIWILDEFHIGIPVTGYLLQEQDFSDSTLTVDGKMFRKMTNNH